MSIRDKIRATNGLENKLSGYNIGKIPNNFRKRDEFVNNIYLQFAEENNLNGFYKNNRRAYRGNFSPLVENAYIISINYYSKFITWLGEKYPTREEKH